jgi:hypothetical protein
MQKLRIVTLGISGGGSLNRPFRDARRFPYCSPYSHVHVRRESLGFDIVLWPFSVAACRTLHRSIRNFFVAIKGGALHRVAGERRDGQGDVYSTTSTVFLQPRQVSQEVYPQVSLANPPHAGSS